MLILLELNLRNVYNMYYLYHKVVTSKGSDNPRFYE